MGKKKKFVVDISKEYCVVAEDEDQALLKVQQYLNIPMKLFKEFNHDVGTLDMGYEKMCGRPKLTDGVDIE